MTAADTNPTGPEGNKGTGNEGTADGNADRSAKTACACELDGMMVAEELLRTDSDSDGLDRSGDGARSENATGNCG